MRSVYEEAVIPNGTSTVGLAQEGLFFNELDQIKTNKNYAHRSESVERFELFSFALMR
jgi:hypothetical protein